MVGLISQIEADQTQGLGVLQLQGKLVSLPRLPELEGATKGLTSPSR